VQREESDALKRAAGELLALAETALGRAGKDAVPPPLAAQLHFEAARLSEFPLAELEAAKEHLKKALALRPTHVQCLVSARRLHLLTGELSANLPLLEAQLRQTESPGGRVTLLREKAELLTRLGKSTEAISAREQLTTLQPDRAAPLAELALALRRAGKAHDAATHLRRSAEALSHAPQLAAILLGLAARIVESVDKDAAAATELAKSAFALAPDTTGVAAQLARLLGAQGRWLEQSEVLAHLAEHAPSAAARAAAHSRRARLLGDRLARWLDAVDALQQAHLAQPRDLSLLEELALALERLGRWEQLVQVLIQGYELVPAGTARLGLALRIGQLYHEALQDGRNAAQWCAQELEHHPLSLGAFRALTALYKQQERWEELGAVLQGRAVAVQEPRLRAELFCQLAELQEHRLNQPSRAIDSHARALAAEPGYAPSFMALARLLSQAGRTLDLIALYEQAVDRASHAETKLAYLYKLGRLYEDALKDPVAATAIYRRIEGHTSTRIDALHAVQRTAEAGRQWKELVEALDRESSLTKDAPRRLGLLHRAAQITLQHLEDSAGAIQRWRKLLELDSDWLPALDSLAEQLAANGHWEDWLAVARKRATLETDAAAKAAQLHEMAQVVEQRLGRRAEAIELYREALATVGDYRLALSGLERLLALEERWAELVDLLRAPVPGVTDPSWLARRHTRAAELLEHRLNRPGEALNAVDAALAAMPTALPARSTRLELLQQLGNSAVLDAALEAELSAEPALMPQVELHLRRGELARDELAQSTLAQQHFSAALQSSPGHLPALLNLEAGYHPGRDDEALCSTLGQLAAALGEPDFVIDAHLRRANCFERLGRHTEGLSVLPAVVALRPLHIEALRGLETLALRQGDRDLLAQLDERLARAEEDPKLVALHLSRLGELREASGIPGALEAYLAAIEKDPESLAAIEGLGRLALAAGDALRLEQFAELELRTLRDLPRAEQTLVRAAQLHHAQRDFDGAARLLERALDVNPDGEDCARALVQLLRAMRQVDHLVTALSKAASLCRQTVRSAALWSQVATLQAEERHDLPAAIATLGRVTSLLPKEPLPWLELGLAYARDGQTKAAADKLERCLELRPTSGDGVRAHVELARLYEGALSQPDRALSHLEAALTLAPAHPVVLGALFDLHRSRGDLPRALEVGTQWVQTLGQHPDSGRVHLELARLHRQFSQDSQSIDQYCSAVQLLGQGHGASRELVEYLEARLTAGHGNDFARYASALSRYIDALPARSQAYVPAVLELARALDAKLAQPRRGVEVLQAAHTQVGDDLSLLAELARLEERSGDPQSALQSYRKLLLSDTTQPGPYRGIVTCLQALHRPAEAVTAAAALVVLGQAGDYDAVQVSNRVPLALRVSSSLVDDPLLHAFAMPQPQHPVSGLFTAISEALDRLEEPRLERFGLTAKDRLTSRTGHPLRAVADRVAAALSVEDFQLYLAPTATLPAVELAPEPALILPNGLETLPEAVQAFALARLMLPLRRRWQAVDAFDDATLQAWFAAALRLVDDNWGAHGPSGEAIGVASRRLSKALPWGRKGRVEEAARACLEAKAVSVGDWGTQVRLASARVALVLADDLVGALTWLRSSEGDLSGLPPNLAARGTWMLHDLLRTWVSEAAFATRRNLGIS